MEQYNSNSLWYNEKDFSIFWLIEQVKTMFILLNPIFVINLNYYLLLNVETAYLKL